MKPTELYAARLWTAWSRVPEPQLVAIPANKAQLLARVSGPAFDGGRTASWLSSTERLRWHAVRDSRTGHTIHCVSDRSYTDLVEEFRLGLRLMAWMSQRSIVWYWWDQHWIREVPAGIDPGRDHVNGGWAVPGILEIHVYRREEAHKVALHEMIHALGLDVPAAQVEPVYRQFCAALGRELWVHLGEAYTELFAEWLWSIAQAPSIRVQRRIWALQCACSQRQAAQVWARVRDTTVPEDTNVFAYYVLKWVLMQHLTEALLGPTHSVDRWFAWWVHARSRLDALADAVAHTEGLPLKMGMTCAYASTT